MHRPFAPHGKLLAGADGRHHADRRKKLAVTAHVKHAVPVFRIAVDYAFDKGFDHFHIIVIVIHHAVLLLLKSVKLYYKIRRVSITTADNILQFVTRTKQNAVSAEQLLTFTPDLLADAVIQNNHRILIDKRKQIRLHISRKHLLYKLFVIRKPGNHRIVSVFFSGINQAAQEKGTDKKYRKKEKNNAESAQKIQKHNNHLIKLYEAWYFSVRVTQKTAPDFRCCQQNFRSYLYSTLPYTLIVTPLSLTSRFFGILERMEKI